MRKEESGKGGSLIGEGELKASGGRQILSIYSKGPRWSLSGVAGGRRDLKKKKPYRRGGQEKKEKPPTPKTD